MAKTPDNIERIKEQLKKIFLKLNDQELELVARRYTLIYNTLRRSVAIQMPQTFEDYLKDFRQDFLRSSSVRVLSFLSSPNNTLINSGAVFLNSVAKTQEELSRVAKRLGIEPIPDNTDQLIEVILKKVDKKVREDIAKIEQEKIETKKPTRKESGATPKPANRSNNPAQASNSGGGRIIEFAPEDVILSYLEDSVQYEKLVTAVRLGVLGGFLQKAYFAQPDKNLSIIIEQIKAFEAYRLINSREPSPANYKIFKNYQEQEAKEKQERLRKEGELRASITEQIAKLLKNREKTNLAIKTALDSYTKNLKPDQKLLFITELNKSTGRPNDTLEKLTNIEELNKIKEKGLEKIIEVLINDGILKPNSTQKQEAEEEPPINPVIENEAEDNTRKEFSLEEFNLRLQAISIETQNPVTITFDANIGEEPYTVRIFVTEQQNNPKVVNLGTKNIEDAKTRRHLLVDYLTETLNLSVIGDTLSDEVSPPETDIPEEKLISIELKPCFRALLATLTFEGEEKITVDTGFYSNIDVGTREIIIESLQKNIGNFKRVEDINAKLAEIFPTRPEEIKKYSKPIDGIKVAFIETGFPRTIVLQIRSKKVNNPEINKQINLCTISEELAEQRASEVLKAIKEGNTIPNYYTDVSVKLEGNTLTLMRAKGTEELTLYPNQLSVYNKDSGEQTYYNKIVLNIPEGLEPAQIDKFVEKVNTELKEIIEDVYKDEMVAQGESTELSHLREKPAQPFRAFQKAVKTAVAEVKKETSITISTEPQNREYPRSIIIPDQRSAEIIR